MEVLLYDVYTKETICRVDDPAHGSQGIQAHSGGISNDLLPVNDEVDTMAETETSTEGGALPADAGTTSFYMAAIFVMSMIVGLMVFSSLSRRWTV